MSIDNLRSGLPRYAKDMKLNLGTLTWSTKFSEQQLWGALPTSAAAARNETVFSKIAEEAKEHLSVEAFETALSVTAVMGINNVVYHTRRILGDDYAQVKFNLRTSIISKPGVEEGDSGLWSLAVSVINGYEACVASHVQVARGVGLTKGQIWEAVKVTGTVSGVTQAVFAKTSYQIFGAQTQLLIAERSLQDYPLMKQYPRNQLIPVPWALFLARFWLLL